MKKLIAVLLIVVGVVGIWLTMPRHSRIAAQRKELPCFPFCDVAARNDALREADLVKHGDPMPRIMW